jgi:hypothetical protein
MQQSYKWQRKIREMIHVANEYDIIVFSGKFFPPYASFCFILLSDRQEMAFKHT